MALKEMIEMQKRLQKTMGYNIDDMSPRERTNYIKEYALHLHTETGEMLMELPFYKPWKTYTKMSLDKAREEYIDMMHFMLSIGIALGMDDKRMLREFERKHVINNDRQERPEYKKC